MGRLRLPDLSRNPETCNYTKVVQIFISLFDILSSILILGVPPDRVSAFNALASHNVPNTPPSHETCSWPEYSCDSVIVPSRWFARNSPSPYVLACDTGEPLTDRRREALCGFSVA